MDNRPLEHTFRGLLAAIFIAGIATVALADATVPTKDIDGSADNALVKRYEGSFIVAYERLNYTDFSVPLSPLERSADEDERDQSNNRVVAPKNELELEGTLTRLAYVLPEGRSPLEVLRNYQDVLEEAGGSVLFECKREDCGGNATRSSSGGGNVMSLMQYFFYEADLKDALYSIGDCALTSKIGDSDTLPPGYHSRRATPM